MNIVEMRGITKRFGTLVANDKVDIDLGRGEIHALLGENGAGKSTLMKILYGLYQPDEVTITIEGRTQPIRSPAEAIERGVGFVSQHFSLVPTFTVAENILLGYEQQFRLDPAQMHTRVAQLATDNGFNIDPSAIVGKLSVGQQQRVEILKAIFRDCRVLILDEPTAVLTPRDTQSLFEILLKLCAQGLAVIIITHKLEEALQHSQRVTVLRHGKVVGSQETSSTTSAELARLMVGRQTTPVQRPANANASEPVVLEVSGLSVADKRGVHALNAVNFQVRAGEIVGIAGVAGNGQSELVSVLTGMLQPQRGAMRVDGQAVAFGDPRACTRHKIGRIPEDRLRGVIGDLSVADNLMIEQLDQFTIVGHLQPHAILEHAQRLINDFQIKAAPNDPVRTLSGGNIQKVILARTLAQDPAVVIAAQPTRGVDIGATEYVHQKLLEQKQRGAAILLISEDLDEILLLSDRILVMYNGRLVGEFDAAAVDLDRLSLLMTGAEKTG
ncbi:MAG: ABC transporter ATP-binding protein [Anaerolineae bacterium]|nr:ABC transporter ATP-binding protein [Anaerolineae bacterium]